MTFPGVLRPSAVPGLYATVGRAVTAYAGAVRVAGRNAAASSLNWPGASVPGAFLPLSGQRISAVPSAVCVHGEVGGVSGACSASQCGENRAERGADTGSVTGRRDGCFIGGSRASFDPKPRDVTRRHADQSLTAGRDRHQNPKAKEPFAILSCQGVPVTGGSSRRPVSRVTGPSCSGETAAEAHEGRSGWKPRTSPLSGGVSRPCSSGRSGVAAHLTHHPSAAPPSVASCVTPAA